MADSRAFSGIAMSLYVPLSQGTPYSLDSHPRPGERALHQPAQKPLALAGVAAPIPPRRARENTFRQRPVGRRRTKRDRFPPRRRRKITPRKTVQLRDREAGGSKGVTS